MIYNRTGKDVEQAKEIRAKIQVGETISQEEADIMERGTITSNTLNRISQKQAELKALLDENGYFCGAVSVRDWNYSDVFRLADFENLIANLTTLRTAFFALRKTPANPLPKYHFSNINDLEKILFDLESNLDYMIANFPECGNYECGE